MSVLDCRKRQLAFRTGAERGPKIARGTRSVPFCCGCAPALCDVHQLPAAPVIVTLRSLVLYRRFISTSEKEDASLPIHSFSGFDCESQPNSLGDGN